MSMNKLRDMIYTDVLHVSHGNEQRTSVDKLEDLQIVYYTYEYSNQAMRYTTVSLDTFTLTEETN